MRNRLLTPPTTTLLAALLCTAYAFIGINSYRNYSQTKQSNEQQLHGVKNSVDKKFKIINTETYKNLSTLHASISRSVFSATGIQLLLTPLAYKHENLVRFLWVNADDQIQLSSHTDFKTFRVDIAERDYIKKARARPNQLVLSPQLKHVNLEKEIITLSMGVTNSQHRYMGAAMATIDLTLLRGQIAPFLENCHCHFALTTPHNQTLTLPTLTQPIITYSLTLDSLWLKNLRAHHLFEAAKWCALFTLLITGVFMILRRKILRPLSQALTLIPAAASASTATSIEQLSSFAHDYNHMKQRLNQQEAMLKECTDVIEQLQSQQAHFLEASGTEMQHMFNSIQRYANHLEEMVLQQQLQPDAPYEFDDVREMGENLRHLSQCFLSFTQQESQQNQAADPALILRQSLRELEPFMERRNLQLSLSQGREIWIMQPASTQLTSALTRAMLFAAIRFAEDEARLDINLSTLNEKVILKLDVNHFRQSSLPPHEQNFSMFDNSKRRDMTQPIQQKLSKHANILMAQTISQKLKGNFRLEVPDSHHGFILHSELAVN